MSCQTHKPCGLPLSHLPSNLTTDSLQSVPNYLMISVSINRVIRTIWIDINVWVQSWSD